MLISIVVPSRTGQVDGLHKQLRCQSLQGWELVVQQGTAPPARARNLAAARAQGKLLIFLDDDIQLGHEHLLAEMVEALRTIDASSAVAVGWRLPSDATPFQRRQMKDSFDKPMASGGERLVAIPWYGIGASCFVIRRRTFEVLGGFDEQLVSGEDPEFWYRLSLAGGRPYLLSGRWIYHYPPRTIAALIRRTIWYESGNAQVMLKHPSSGYRITLKDRWHAVLYLTARTIALVPLMFVKVSYHNRRPTFAFRPMAALLSYIGAWAYCLSWFSVQPTGTGQAPRAEAGSMSMHPQQVLR